MVGAWHGHGMASVNQTRPSCLNQMGKTHSKLSEARQGKARQGKGMGAAWARHAMCESNFLVPWSLKSRAITLPTLWVTPGL